jgi:hypothetical protein
LHLSVPKHPGEGAERQNLVADAARDWRAGRRAESQRQITADRVDLPEAAAATKLEILTK